MPGIRGFGGLLFAAAFVVGILGTAPVAGLTPGQAAGLFALFGVLMLVAASIVEGFARHWTQGLQAVAVGGGLMMALIGVYGARDEIQLAFDRAIGDIAAGRTVTTEGGAVVAARRSDGSFIVNGRVNGHRTRFIFDTGASTVVLGAEHAGDFGFREDALDFTVPVATANGSALAAPVTIESLTVGDITEHNVHALVTRAGVLPANLLGMTFLERLASYEVRGSRLILRPKTPSEVAESEAAQEVPRQRKAGTALPSRPGRPADGWP